MDAEAKMYYRLVAEKSWSPLAEGSSQALPRSGAGGSRLVLWKVSQQVRLCTGADWGFTQFLAACQKLLADYQDAANIFWQAANMFWQAAINFWQAAKNFGPRAAKNLPPECSRHDVVPLHHWPVH